MFFAQIHPLQTENAKQKYDENTMKTIHYSIQCDSMSENFIVYVDNKHLNVHFFSLFCRIFPSVIIITITIITIAEQLHKLCTWLKSESISLSYILQNCVKYCKKRISSDFIVQKKKLH